MVTALAGHAALGPAQVTGLPVTPASCALG